MVGFFSHICGIQEHRFLPDFLRKERIAENFLSVIIYSRVKSSSNIRFHDESWKNFLWRQEFLYYDSMVDKPTLGFKCLTPLTLIKTKKMYVYLYRVLTGLFSDTFFDIDSP